MSETVFTTEKPAFLVYRCSKNNLIEARSECRFYIREVLALIVSTQRQTGTIKYLKFQLACVASVSVGLGAKKDRGTGFFFPREKWGERQNWNEREALVPFFALEKHRKFRFSVFLCSLTPRKRLLRRLSFSRLFIDPAICNRCGTHHSFANIDDVTRYLT